MAKASNSKSVLLGACNVQVNKRVVVETLNIQAYGNPDGSTMLRLQDTTAGIEVTLDADGLSLLRDFFASVLHQSQDRKERADGAR